VTYPASSDLARVSYSASDLPSVLSRDCPTTHRATFASDIAVDLLDLASTNLASNHAASNPTFDQIGSDTEDLGFFNYPDDCKIDEIRDLLSINKKRKLEELNSSMCISPLCANMLTVRQCVSVRFTDIVAMLDSKSCTQSVEVAQLSIILPALQYKSDFLNNHYMAYQMLYCSCNLDHETVFLTCQESKETFLDILASFGIDAFEYLKKTMAWKRLDLSDSINYDTFTKIYKILTKLVFLILSTFNTLTIRFPNSFFLVDKKTN